VDFGHKLETVCENGMRGKRKGLGSISILGEEPVCFRGVCCL
jgi:hypothetical protein